MEKFIRLTGIAATLPVANINTDAIIPARWMTAIDANLSKGLFGGWRYDENDAERADFVLNREPFRSSRILVAGENFGCGSSREQAVWSLLRFGISCVIAPSFADIFYENCYKNGLLPLILPAQKVQQISDALAQAASPGMTVDLENCRVTLPDGTEIAFAIDDTRRRALLQGKDEIDLTLDYDAQISAFQQADRQQRPWIYARELPAVAPAR